MSYQIRDTGDSNITTVLSQFSVSCTGKCQNKRVECAKSALSITIITCSNK